MSSSEKTLFFEALDFAGPERAAFLERVCAGDPEKRKRRLQHLEFVAGDQVVIWEAASPEEVARLRAMR